MTILFMFSLWLFFLLKILIIQTLNKSACCFLTWLSLAPFELKNNGQWLQGMEPSGIIPCDADMCLLSQNVLHKLCPHISHLLLLCILYLWAFRACGVPKALLHSSHCSGVLFSCFTFMCSSKLLPLVKIFLQLGHSYVFLLCCFGRVPRCTRFLCNSNRHVHVLYYTACILAWPHFFPTQLHSPPNGDFCPRIRAS